jgi:nitrogen-specific signal transduction histidine kinase
MEKPRAGIPEAAGDVATRMSQRARQIGHDLNNCLGVVGGRAELVLLQLARGNTDAARKGVQTIIDQMDRMNGLVDSLRRLQDEA